MRAKMLMLVAFVFVLGFSYVSVSKPFYSFSIILPNEVNASANSEIVVDGGILVTGQYWLHNFELNASVSNVEVSYNITPKYWENVRIIREWNPKDGVFIVPENFTIKIAVPKNASGLYAVTVTGQEKWSWRQVTNSSFFILRVGVGEAKPAVNITKEVNVTQNVTQQINITPQPENRTVEENISANITEKNVSTNATQPQGLLINISQYFIGIPALIFAVLLWKSAQMWEFYRIRGRAEEM